MKNILYLSSSGSMGGAETSLYYLVRGLDKSKYSPIVICPENGSLSEKLIAQGIHVEIIPLPSWRKFRSLISRSSSLQRLIKYAETSKINLIHCNTIWVNNYAQKLGAKLGIPVICHLRDIIRTDQVKKYSLDKVDMIIPISDAVQKPIDNAGIPSEKTQRIYNGVDVSLFTHGKDALKKEFGINGYLVGIVGQMNPRSQWKGQREFIHACAEVIKQRSDVWFALVGGDDSPKTSSEYGFYVNELKELTRSLGIENRVIFTGHRTDMPDVMASFDILVSASWAEPFGRVIIEAMAVGKPVIATMAGGAPEIVQDKITGVLVPPKNHQAIAEAILYVIQDNKLQDMGRAGQKRAKEIFSIENHVREVQSLYSRFEV
jgi:glycosyltransferase involved in cell wall biosynthesis